MRKDLEEEGKARKSLENLIKKLLKSQQHQQQQQQQSNKDKDTEENHT